MSSRLSRLSDELMRKKSKYNSETGLEERFLSTVDMTCIGVSVTLGLGVFVILGDVAKYPAGPSVIISYMIAAVTSFLAALCYTELATRFPQAGSSYVYVYACIGELPAVIVASALIFDYVIVSSCCAKCIVQYINYLTNSSSVSDVSYGLTESNSSEIESLIFDQTIDVFSGLTVIIIMIPILFHRQAFALMNNFLMMMTFLICIGVLLVAFFNADTDNWTGGEGFFANGIRGIAAGSAKCYLTFITYDAIATFGRYSLSRCSVLPASYTNSFLVTLLSTFGVSVSTTLLAPYAMTGRHDKTALITLFDIRGITGMQYIAVFGAVCGLLSSAIVCLCASIRLLQNLSEDGFIFAVFGRLSKQNGLPVVGLLILGSTASCLATFSNLDFLLSIVGTGFLISSIGVSGCILVLRYGPHESLPIEERTLRNEFSRDHSFYSMEEDVLENQNERTKKSKNETTELLQLQQSTDIVKSLGGCRSKYGSVERKRHGRNDVSSSSMKSVSVDFINEEYVSSIRSSDNQLCCSQIEEVSPERRETPNSLSTKRTMLLIATSCGMIASISGLTRALPSLVWLPKWYDYVSDVLVCLLLAALLCVLVLLYRKPRHSLDPDVIQFKSPCIPLLPVTVLWTGIYLLTNMLSSALMTFLILTIIVSSGYILHGRRRSKEKYNSDENEVLSNANCVLQQENDQLESQLIDNK